MRWRLVSLLLAYIGNGEGFASDGAESLLAFLLAGKLAAGGGKLGIAVMVESSGLTSCTINLVPVGS